MLNFKKSNRIVRCVFVMNCYYGFIWFNRVPYDENTPPFPDNTLAHGNKRVELNKVTGMVL